MSSRSVFDLALLAGAVLAAGCERARPQASAAQEPTVADDSVTIQLEAPASVPAGATVPFRLILANATDRQVTLYLLGREITYDVAVSGPDGALVWRRLDDSSFQEILAVRSLGPREQIVLQTEWTGARPAGSYTATAKVLTDGDPLQSPPIRFTIQ